MEVVAHKAFYRAKSERIALKLWSIIFQVLYFKERSRISAIFKAYISLRRHRTPIHDAFFQSCTDWPRTSQCVPARAGSDLAHHGVCNQEAKPVIPTCDFVWDGSAANPVYLFVCVRGN